VSFSLPSHAFSSSIKLFLKLSIHGWKKIKIKIILGGAIFQDNNLAMKLFNIHLFQEE
jgi:hypothetical protein